MIGVIGLLIDFGLKWVSKRLTPWADQASQTVQVNNLTFAGEHLSDEFYGFMNGAAQTGRLTAQAVVRQLKAQK